MTRADMAAQRNGAWRRGWQALRTLVPHRMSRRLLLVSQRPLEYGGGGSVRWRFFARELPRHGWEVETVTARANPTANEVSTDAVSAGLAAARARVMGAVGTALRPACRSLGFQPEALAPNGLWALTGRRTIAEAIRRVQPHVVWATGPPPSAFFAAAAVTRESALPLVTELRDLWAGNPYFDAGGTVLARIERRTLAQARAVVSVTEGCRDRLLALHPEVASKFELLPNGFEPRLLELRAPARPSNPDTRATLLHAGTLYGDRTAVTLIRALGRDDLRGRVRLELLGTVDPETEAAAREASLEVSVEPSSSWEVAVERTRRADIAVVINGSGTGGDMALPSKLFEALALGRPVLALTAPDSDTERLLTRLGLGTGCAGPLDEDGIAGAVSRLLDQPPPAVDPARLEPWDRSRVARRVAGLLDELIGEMDG